MSEVRGSGLECQAVTAQERPRGVTLCLRSGSAAKRSYPASEVSGGGWEELSCVRGQGWPRGATPASKVSGSSWEELPRVCSQGQQLGGDSPCPKSGAVAERSYPMSEASGGWEETPRVRDQGQPGEATLCPSQGQ